MSKRNGNERNKPKIKIIREWMIVSINIIYIVFCVMKFSRLLICVGFG